MSRSIFSALALVAAFILSSFGTARAVITPDITFTSAKVAISRDTDAKSGSPDDSSCANHTQDICDKFSLSATFTVNGGDDLLSDLSTSGNQVVLWLGHNTLCGSGQPQAVFHTILNGASGIAHTNKTTQSYKFKGMTNAEDDSNGGSAVAAVAFSITVSINLKKNTGTLKASGTGDFEGLSPASDHTIGVALVTNEASSDSDDQTSSLVTNPGDLNCTGTATATYKEADPD